MEAGQWMGEKTLSGVGREVLIKAVLQSIPNYIMSCFELPLYHIRTLESAIRRVWWGGGLKQKMAWLSWEELCKPKCVGGLGFRDLRSFNLALLAKQSWRLLIHPTSLMGKVFKGKYFPHSNFLNAHLGPRPSATWRGILKARVFFEKGLRTRIGNGQATRIWGTPWIPDDGHHRVFTPQPLNSLFPDRVADLIDPMMRTWRVELIEEVFWPVDRARILAIPIGATEVEDRLIWHHAKDGKFSVKSCYHYIQVLRSSSMNSQGPSNSGMSAKQWNLIWTLKLPPKIRIFLWRACANILPTKVALFRRHIAANPYCDRCGLEVESLTHALFVCRDSQDIWRGEPFKLRPFETQTSMWTVMEEIRQSTTHEAFMDALVLCWKLCEIRNKETHGSMEATPREICAWAREYRSSYENAQVGTAMRRDDYLDTIWRPPDPWVIKINVDVALPGGHDFFRIGLVARDSTRTVVWWRVKLITGRPSPVDGEAMGVYQGVLLARDMTWPRVAVETDCYQVFHYFSPTLFSRSFISFGALIDACLVHRSRFVNLSFSFIRSSGNSLAHSLATDLDVPCDEGSLLPSWLI